MLETERTQMNKRPTIHGVKVIYFMLGAACNFSCPHCIQHEFHPRIKKEVSPKVLSWLQNIADSRPESAKPKLMFWGGEPLLYLKTMKQVVEALGDRYEYAMVSNGSLLTQEIVDWLNANKIEFIYSNDGKQTCKTRDKNMFEDESFVKLFNQIEIRAVDGVFHAHNQNLYEFWDYVETKSPDIPIHLEELACGTNVPNSYLDFDMNEIQAMFDRMKGDVLGAVKTGQIERSVIYLQHYIGNILYPKRSTSIPKCGACLRHLNVDTDGKLYFCHNDSRVIGTVDDEFDDIVERAKEFYENLFNETLKAKGCLDCEAFQYCAGDCPFEKPSENQKKVCEIRRMAYRTAQACIGEFNQMVKQ